MNNAFASTPVRAAVLLLALGLGGCSSFDNGLSGDRIDYGKAARKTNPLETPPDLTPLSRDGRYLPQSGSVSASQLQQQGPRTTAAAATLVAPQALGDLRIERQGDVRWLVSPLPPEQLFGKVRQFWLDRGFTLSTDSAEAGVIETEWAENRAKIPSDIVRNTIGRVLDSLYSTGERDRFRARLERSAAGTEITVTHRGLEEVFINKSRDDGATTWTARPRDVQLEAEMLTRLMISLGAPEASARAAQTASLQPQAAPADKARALTDQAGAALQVDDLPERAWRRVGLALDRSGFTVEDRDRAQLLYFVRYADPKSAGNEEPGFFARLFTAKGTVPLSRFRLALKASGNGTQVAVLNDQGTPDASAGAANIVKLLVDELKN